MAVAKSPGSMVTAEKITIETTNSVTSPSPSRCNTVLRTGFTPSISRPASLTPPQFPDADRAAAPIIRAPRLLQPNVVEIAVVRLADDVDVNSGSLGTLLVENSGIDRAVEGGVRDREIDLERRQSGLLQVELRLLDVV